MDVLHRCDVPSCVNPDHLFAGTQKDNSIDMARKGRQGLQKLSGTEVQAIRQDRRKQKEIAVEYSISRAQVCRIKSGKRWAYLEGAA
jgi:hypothetical protein